MSNNPSEEKPANEQVGHESTVDDSVDSKKTADSRTKFKIPEFPKQKELTPEQKLEKEKDRRRRRKAHLLKTRIRNSLFGIAIIIFLAVLFYFTIAKKDRPESVDVAAPEVVSDFSLVLNSTDPSEIIRYSESLLKNLLSQSLPNQITQLKKQMQLGQRLIDLNADEDSRKFGVNAKLDSLIFLDTLNLVYDLNDTSFRGLLFELAQEKLDDEDMAICRKAHLGICLSLTHDYSRNQTDEAFAKLLAQFRISTPKLCDDLPSAASLARLVTLAAQSSRKDHVVELMNFAGTEFKKSNDEKIRSLGAKFHDDVFVGNFDFNAIAQQMLIRNEDSLMQLALAVDAVTANSQISEVPFSKVLSLAENLSQIDQDELRQQYVDRLREASNQVTDEETAAKIQQLFADYDKRNSLVGKTFSLVGAQFDGQPLDDSLFDDKIVVVVYFGLRHDVSRELLSRLNDYEYLVSQGVQFIVDCVDDEVNPETLLPLTKMRGVHVVTRSSAPGYLEQCPISKVPYVVVMNRRHEVVAANLNVDKLRARLEQLLGLIN